MLSAVLNTPVAVQASVAIARAFVLLRRILSTHKAISRRVEDIESRMKEHDIQIRNLFEAIYELMAPPRKARRQIGFQPQRQ